MADTVSPEVRSRIMARVKGSDTLPELALSRALRQIGVRGYRCDYSGVVGKPDLAFTRWCLAVFVDGAFWHGHPSRYWPGRTSDYWDEKIARNKARDEKVNYELRTSGWTVLRYWDFEVLEDPEGVAQRVASSLDWIKSSV